MKGWRWMSLVAVPGAILLGVGAESIAQMAQDVLVDRDRRTWIAYGATAVNPHWSTPRFCNAALDDYRIFDLLARQRFSSPTVDAGDPLVDEALPAAYVNLLTNPGFESGMTAWTSHAEGMAGTAGPGAHEGASYFLPGETAAAGDHDPATPLQMMTPNTKNRIHSQFGNLALIRQFDPGPEAQIHPDDAVARNIAHGDRVTIANKRGELTVTARIDAGIRRGCIAVTNGWWDDQDGLVNKLSEGRETDVAHGAAFHDNLVEVRRA